MNKPQSICIIRLTSLGDIMLLTPMIRALRNAWPNARIDMIISKQCAEIMRFNPRVDNLHVIDTKTGTFDFLKQWIRIKKTMPIYDLAIDVHDSIRSKVIRIGIGKTLSIYDSARSYKRSLIKNKSRIPIPSIIPIPQRYFSALNDFPEVHRDEKGLEFWLEDEKSNGVYPEQRVRSGERILIAPGARHATKRWPASKFVELISLLDDTFHVPIALIGGPDDASLCGEISRMSTIPIEDYSGKMNLHEIASFMDTAHCIIGNDSGLMHVAASRHIPLITMFGSTVPEFGFLPYRTPNEIISLDLPCKPCTHIGKEKCPEGHFSCMNDISSSMVLSHVKSLLDSQRLNKY